MAHDNRQPAPLSPTEKFNQLNSVFGTRKLAKLLRTKTSHLIGFSAGELPLGGRRTERLDVLHKVVDGLSTSYNPIGINQWFDKKRSSLGQQSPRYVLEAYPWRKADRAVKQINRLVKDLTTPPAV